MSIEHISCLAVVLKTSPYGESDLCVDLFTAQVGRARVMARGAQKSARRYMGTLELGALLKVDYRPKLHSLPTLGPCDVISSPWRARTALPRLAQLYYILELVARSTGLDDPDEGLFQSLVELLQLLEGPEGLSQLELLAWELALFQRLGYQLRIDRCPYTGLAPDALSLREGGSLHTSARRPCSPVPTSALRTLYRLQRRASVDDDLSLDGAELKAVREAFRRLWAELCGSPLKSYPFLAQVLELDPPPPRLAPDLAASTHADQALSVAPPSALPDPVSAPRASLLGSPLSVLLTLLLALLLTPGCAQVPQAAKGTLQSDEELIVEELEEVVKQQSLSGELVTTHTKTSLKEALTRSLQRARSATPEAALNAQLSPLSQPFSPAALDPFMRGLREGGVLALRFQTPTGELRCALSPSPLSLSVLQSLQAHEGQLDISSNQPGLWLSHSFTLTSPAEVGEQSPTHKPPLPAPPTRPLDTRGGDWVAISGREVIEALILEGPTPWIPTSSHLIGRCESNATLKSLTRLDTARAQQPRADLKLTLTQLGWISREVPSSP